jgi:hypothetical protein
MPFKGYERGGKILKDALIVDNISTFAIFAIKISKY